MGACILQPQKIYILQLTFPQFLVLITRPDLTSDIGKGKDSPWQFVQLCPTLGHGTHPRLQAIELAFVQRQSSVVTWPALLDTECHDLPTKVVPIYLLAFLHAFERLGWRELGQATGARCIAWIQSYNCWSSDPTAQRLLRFNIQCHRVPSAGLLICL